MKWLSLMMREMNILEYLKDREDDDILVDLRSETMYAFGTIPGAIHIPVERVGELYELPKEKPIYLFCQVGEISGQFAELLSDARYACNLTGGYREYLRQSINDGEKYEIHSERRVDP